MTETTVAIDARLAFGSSTGDSTYWTGLLLGLAANKREGARFLLFSNAGRPAGIPEDERFTWISLPARSSRWWSLVAFPLAARRAGAQVAHTQYTLSPLARNGITTIHDVSFFIGPEWFKAKDRMILSRTVPAAARRAKAVLAVSETDKREIEQYIPSATGKVVVTPNARPPWIERVPKEEAVREIGEKLGVQTPFLLTVGTRWPRKNMALALDAAELLPDDLPHQMIVTGKPGWGEERFGRRARAVGYVSNRLLSCLYSAADLYLAPSRHEGFGVPLLEAFHCGCPVVCSTGGALPEVAGGAALVAPTWESADWAKLIGELLRDSSNMNALRQRGFEREKQFSWEETARLTLDAYEGAMR